MNSITPQKAYSFLNTCLKTCLDPKEQSAARASSALTLLALGILTLATLRIGKGLVGYVICWINPPNPQDKNDKENQNSTTKPDNDDPTSKTTDDRKKEENLLDDKKNNVTNQSNLPLQHSLIPPVPKNDQNNPGKIGNSKGLTITLNPESPQMNDSETSTKVEQNSNKPGTNNNLTSEPQTTLTLDEMGKKFSDESLDNKRMKATAKPLLTQPMDFERLYKHLGQGRFAAYLQKIPTPERQKRPKTIGTFNKMAKKADSFFRRLNRGKKNSNQWIELSAKESQNINPACLRYLVLTGKIHAYSSLSEKYAVFFEENQLEAFKKDNPLNYIFSKQSLLSLINELLPFLDFVFIPSDKELRSDKNCWTFCSWVQLSIIDKLYTREVSQSKSSVKPIDLKEFHTESDSITHYAIAILNTILAERLIYMFGLNSSKSQVLLQVHQEDLLEIPKSIGPNENIRWYKLFNEQIEEVKCQVDENGKVIPIDKPLKSEKE